MPTIPRALLATSLLLIAGPVGLAVGGVAVAQAPRSAPAGYDALVALFRDWRAFEAPRLIDDVPDYGTAAMAEKAARLPAFRERLAKISTEGWSIAERNDLQLVKAEMDGLDFNLRVLRPWARDPGFYATIYPFMSDVPAHEGQSAKPDIDLYAYAYPLSPASQRALGKALRALPRLYAQARINLAGGDAHDLWVYGAHKLHNQAAALTALEKGTLEIRTMDGRPTANLDGVSADFRNAVETARMATEDFAIWLEEGAKSRHGTSGVGQKDYDWYLRNVHLSPYSWNDEVGLLWRELYRAHAALRAEEERNRNLPELTPVEEREAFYGLEKRRFADLIKFLMDNGFITSEPAEAAALRAQMLPFVPEERRHFFDKGTHRDPMGIFTHDFHYVELVHFAMHPPASPIRRVVPLYNIWDNRCEGLATALEEILMQAGLYDDTPRGREIVWMMLANRAARGLAALYAQANMMTLEEAGAFQARWTPRGWAEANGELTAFEQSLYLRQPGYGSSYITGKVAFDRLITQASRRAFADKRSFSLGNLVREVMDRGYIPMPLLEREISVDEPGAVHHF